MRNLILIILGATAITAVASANKYIESDSGFRHEDILHIIAANDGVGVVVKCNGFTYQACMEYGLAGANIVLNAVNYSHLDVTAILEAVNPDQITIVSTGLDGFSLVNFAKYGTYMRIAPKVNVGAKEMKDAVRVSPEPSRVSVYVRNASITAEDIQELRDLGANVVL